MIGKTISHYKILELLGEGAMGEVYLAEDFHLERQVALKFLPQYLTSDKENLERFKREAKATAAINYPNIITIYDIIETDCRICIIMEYADGKTLRDVMNEYILEIDKIIDVTAQICNGLTLIWEILSRSKRIISQISKLNRVITGHCACIHFY
jgi:serine/threonine protein kinase